MTDSTKIYNKLMDIRKEDDVDDFGREFLTEVYDGSIVVPYDAWLGTYLIKCIRIYFGRSLDADILMMSFRLLEGYDSKECTNLDCRYEHFLKDSSYLAKYPVDGCKSYDEIFDDPKKILKAKQKLIKKENQLIVKLSDRLAKNLNSKDDVSGLEEYGDKKINGEKISYFAKKQAITNESKIKFETDQQKESNSNVVRTEQYLSENESSNNFTLRTNERTANTKRFPKLQKANSKKMNSKLIAFMIASTFVIIAFTLLLLYYSYEDSIEIQDIWTPETDIYLDRGESYQIEAATIPRKIFGTKLMFVSADSKIATVSQSGLIKTYDEYDEKGELSTSIIIQSPNGASKTIAVHIYEMIDLNKYLAEEEQKAQKDFNVHIYATFPGEEWNRTAKAKIGDTIACMIEYKNNSEYTQHDIMLKAILPKCMKYIQNSTTIYNKDTDNWDSIASNEICNSGIRIGNCYSGRGEQIAFEATIQNDEELSDVNNTLEIYTEASTATETKKSLTYVFIDRK